VRLTAAAMVAGQQANANKNPGDTAQPGVGPIPIDGAREAEPPPEAIKANAATAD